MEKIFTNFVKQLCLNFVLADYFLFLLALLPKSTVPNFSLLPCGAPQKQGKKK
jgi:hypothetical protein